MDAAKTFGYRTPEKIRRSVLLLQAWWEERILRGVASYAAEHDWEVQCRMRWTHEVPRLNEWTGDGIIAFAGISPHMKKVGRRMVQFIRRAKVPVVETQEIGNYFNAPKVIVPHAAIGRVAAEYFIGLNYQHIGFVTFEENILERSRRQAFQLAVEKAGRTFHAVSFAQLSRSLKTLPFPIGLLAVNDANALDVIRVCRKLGISIPIEVAVLGIDDDNAVCDLAAVPLSSVNCNYERQGYEAAALLDCLMKGMPAPSQPSVVLPAGITTRYSTDIVAIPDRATAEVLLALRNRFREPITIQQIARELKISLRQVHDRFCLHVGRTMAEELSRLRLENAKTLLADKTLKLHRVAIESGFSSRFHLTTAFKRTTGMTPRGYRGALFEKDPRDGRTAKTK